MITREQAIAEQLRNALDVRRIWGDVIFNVKNYGAYGDGETDDAAAIQKAIMDCAGNGGGTVYFPPGEYLVGATLSVLSNVHLVGSGIDTTIIRDHGSLGANRLFFIQGAPGDYVQNISFSNMTLRNGTASENTYTVGKDAIRCEYVDGLTVQRCKITEIQGAFGLVVKYTRNVLVQNCLFYRWTYAGMYVLVESENIHVIDNTFDTATAQNISQTYTFGTGGETFNEGDFLVRNLWIERNIFRNNSRWEGIDCHGGENIWIRDNYVENCRNGIMVGLVVGYALNPSTRNVYIENNIILQGSGQADQAGIVLAGSVQNDTLFATEHVIIRNNYIHGFGGETSNTIGAITVYSVKDLVVENNTVDNYSYAAICLYYMVWGAKILNNIIKNCRGSGGPSSFGVVLRSVGLYDILVQGNILNPDEPSKAPMYFLGNSTPNNRLGAVQIKDNTVLHVATGMYNGIGALPVEKTSAPTVLTAKFGDVILKDTGVPGWYVSAPKIGMGSQITSVIVTVDIEADSNVATIVSDEARDYRDLPPGMNITIAGAGPGGANLNARIVKNDGKNLTLNTAAETTVTGANLTYQGITLQSV